MSFPKYLFLLLAPAALLSAQGVKQTEIKFDVEGHLNFALPSLTKLTNRTLGGGLGLGVTLPVGWAKGEVECVRFSFNYNDFPGKKRLTAKNSLRSYQLCGDLYFPTGLAQTSWFLGVSVNRFSVKNEGTETWAPSVDSAYYWQAVDTFMIRPSEIGNSPKAGLRAGLSRRFSRNLTVELTFQQTELSQRKWDELTLPNDKGRPETRVTEGKAVNPCWAQVGLRYTF